MVLLIIAALLPPGSAQTPPDKDYLVYLVCESADVVVIVRFGPKGARIERQVPVGLMPVDIDGPHGIAFSPDREFYYVSVAHGRPNGSLWKYRTRDDNVMARTDLGMFPATTDVTPDGNFAYVVNFNLHGDMVPSSVSVVATDEMVEVARIPTCTMPHGSRVNPQGTRQYSACMMDDMLVEIDTRTFKVARHFVLTQSKERGVAGSPALAEHAHGDVAAPARPAPHDVTCAPTWAQPSSDGKSVFVACNKSSQILEILTSEWKLARRIPAGEGVYNLALSKNGLLVATNKRGQSVSVFDVKTGKEMARIRTRRKVVHGAVVSPDDRYAFITVEGVGEEPGTLEVIDLATWKTVATVDVGAQAAGIDFARIEPAK